MDKIAFVCECIGGSNPKFFSIVSFNSKIGFKVYLYSFFLLNEGGKYKEKRFCLLLEMWWASYFITTHALVLSKRFFNVQKVYKQQSDIVTFLLCARGSWTLHINAHSHFPMFCLGDQFWRQTMEPGTYQIFSNHPRLFERHFFLYVCALIAAIVRVWFRGVPLKAGLYWR